MTKRLCLLFTGIALLLVAVWWAFWPEHYIIITDITSRKVIMEKPVLPGDDLWVVFINSVEKLPVGDHFEINHDYHITFVETIYMAEYVGYIHQERAKEISPGVMMIPYINKLMDKVTFFAGYQYKHFLFFNGDLIPLYKILHGGDLIQIKVKRRARFLK